MIKDIAFAGLSTAAADYSVADGALSTSINLINEDGGLVPVGEPLVIRELGTGERAVAVHDVASRKLLIIATLSGSTTHFYFDSYDLPEGGEQSRNYIGSVVGFRQIVAIGNVLAVSTTSDVRFFIWRGHQYADLGNRPPFITLEFGMKKAGEVLDSDDILAPASLMPNIFSTGNGASTGRRLENEAGLTEFSNAVLGLLLSGISENVAAKGRFYQPFFVRYAFRMFDGNYSWQSAPVLMLPNLSIPVVRITEKKSETDGYYNCSSTLHIPFFQLVKRVVSSDADIADLANWKDIISSIDIFISRPVYTYDQSAQLVAPYYCTEKSLRQTGPAAADRPSSSADALRGNSRASSSDSSSILDGHYADVGKSKFEEHFADLNSLTSKVWKIKANDDFAKQLVSVADFYKVASIPLADIKHDMEFSEVAFEVDDISSLENLPRLDDDYLSHGQRIPSCMYSYNSRLNYGGGQLALPKALPFRSLGAVLGSSAVSGFPCTISVWSRYNGQVSRSVMESSATENICDGIKGCMPRFIFHPDPGAFLMRITCGSTSVDIPLKPHDFLNGAYAWLGLGERKMPDVTESAEAASPYSYTPSKIYTSEINNPFLVRAADITNVGSGHVIALASAVSAISQGQFGQFPMYAFTTEGVWALSVSSTGGFSARQPVSREVCISAQSVTSLDASVVFASRTGLMNIQGASVSCLTDSIDADWPLDSAQEMPMIARLHDLAGHLPPDDCTRQISLSRFLENAGIIYDYAQKRLIVFSPDYALSYVYSLKSGAWGMVRSNYTCVVNAYPDIVANTGDGRLVRPSATAAERDAVRPAVISAFAISRPLKFDAPDILKTITAVFLRGNLQPTKCSLMLFGSRDLINWAPVAASRKLNCITGIHGTPYKYFRIAFVVDIADNQMISAASFNLYPRQNNRIR